MILKSQRERAKVLTELKSQILAEILLPDASVSKIAKKYDLSSTTLYGWRNDYIKKTSQNSGNNQQSLNIPENNFIELIPEEESSPKEDSSLSKSPPPSLAIIPVVSNSKLSEVSLIFGDNISLLLKGNIRKSSLIKILSALEEELC